MNARKQYLEELGKEYNRTAEDGRGGLLDEANKRTRDAEPAGSAPATREKHFYEEGI
jgi:hypothetical protein